MLKDLRSNIKVLKGMYSAISSDTTTTGEIIDTANYKSMTLVISAPVYASGTYTPIIYQDGDSTMASPIVVADENMIPQSGGEAAAVIDAANEIHTIGVIGTERYLRLSIVSTSTGSATIAAFWIGEDTTQAVTQG